MKRIILLFLFAVSIQGMWAAIEKGKTYRICPAAKPEKSLFVENASQDDKVPVYLWTETDVPAQQWTVKSMAGARITLVNTYSGKYLSVQNNKLVQGTKTSPIYWVLTEIDAEKNIFTMAYNNKSPSVSSFDDGTQPTMGSEKMEWQFVEVEAQTEFNDVMRDRMAEGFLNQYLQNKGAGYRTFVNGGWGESETQEAVLDMYEMTGENKYWLDYNYCYRYFKNKVGDNWTGGAKDGYHWYGYDFNDDVMWQIIGAARAANIAPSGNANFLADAKRNFDAIYKRANLGYVQLLRWAESSGNRNGTNSCINGPAEVAACYIAIAAADESYFEIAKGLYNNQRTYLFNSSNGHVYDSVVLDPTTGKVVSSNTWASTYNQGTMLGAAVLLYQHYGNETYKRDADLIIKYAMENLCNADGIIKVCQNADGDFQGFKGILMRYAGLYARTFKDEKVSAWLIKNAFHAYNNMNSKHYGHSAWLTKATEDGKFATTKDGKPAYIDYTTQAFGASTAISAAFAVPVPSVTDAIENINDDFCSTSSRSHFAGVYDLNGRRVSNEDGTLPTNLKKGLYIRNGRKIMVR